MVDDPCAVKLGFSPKTRFKYANHTLRRERKPKAGKKGKMLKERGLGGDMPFPRRR